MIEAEGDIWSARRDQDWVVITTNGAVRKDGACVMGAGIAKEAARLYPWLPKALGQCIKNNGMQVEAFPPTRLIMFPVKYHWSEDANLMLIETSAAQLVKKSRRTPDFQSRQCQSSYS